jgi:DNA-binding NarL/FixJ family response regulator
MALPPRMDGLTATREILPLPEPPRVAVLTTVHVTSKSMRPWPRAPGGSCSRHPAAADRRRRTRGRRRHGHPLPRRHRHADRLPRGTEGRPRRAAALERVVTLSDRERELLTLLGNGESNAELARRLFASEATVKTNVSRLLTMLDLTSRTSAAILAQEADLLEG